jgi:hypothetical protein
VSPQAAKVFFKKVKKVEISYRNKKHKKTFSLSLTKWQLTVRLISDWHETQT